jgi:hypothetical protein
MLIFAWDLLKCNTCSKRCKSQGYEDPLPRPFFSDDRHAVSILFTSGRAKLDKYSTQIFLFLLEESRLYSHFTLVRDKDHAKFVRNWPILPWLPDLLRRWTQTYYSLMLAVDRKQKNTIRTSSRAHRKLYSCFSTSDDLSYQTGTGIVGGKFPMASENRH